MGLFSALFGGTDDSAQKSQERQNAETLAFIKQQTGDARKDLDRLFPQASEARRGGYQSALDLLGGSLPQRYDVIQQGRDNVQNTLMAGNDQVINALMGRPTDLSGLRQPAINYNLDFLNQMLPERPEQPQQAGYAPPWLTNPNFLLGGLYR